MIKAVIMAAILTATAHARPREFSIGLAEQQTKGLVAYYPMLVSGTTVLDRSGNGNDGTAVNAPTFSYANGYVGDGVGMVAASSQHVVVTHDAALRGGSAFSLSFWLKSAGAVGSDDMFVGKYASTTGDREYGVFFGPAGGVTPMPTAIRIVLTSDGTYTSSTAKDWRTANGIVSSTEWKHFVVTWNAGTLRLFVNAVEITSFTKTQDAAITSVHAGSANFTLGGRPDAGQYANATLDEVRIWNRALSAAEVLQRWRDDTTLNRGR